MSTKFFAPIDTRTALQYTRNAIAYCGHQSLVTFDVLVDEETQERTVVALPAIARTAVTEAHNEAVMDVACILSTACNVEINASPCGLVYAKVS